MQNQCFFEYVLNMLLWILVCFTLLSNQCVMFVLGIRFCVVCVICVNRLMENLMCCINCSWALCFCVCAKISGTMRFNSFTLDKYLQWRHRLSLSGMITQNDCKGTISNSNNSNCSSINGANCLLSNHTSWWRKPSQHILLEQACVCVCIQVS